MHGCVPADVVNVPLSNGGIALIDRADWFGQFEYHAANGETYRVRPCEQTWWTIRRYITTRMRQGRRTDIRLHRLIMQAEPNQIIDHINGDRSDNRRSNLRFCTRSQNNQNQFARKGSCRFKGVHYAGDAHRTKPWRARIQLNNNQTLLGYFTTPEAAARRYDQAAVELFGEFANLNFPEATVH